MSISLYWVVQNKYVCLAALCLSASGSSLCPQSNHAYSGYPHQGLRSLGKDSTEKSLEVPGCPFVPLACKDIRLAVEISPAVHKYSERRGEGPVFELWVEVLIRAKDNVKVPYLRDPGW